MSRWANDTEKRESKYHDEANTKNIELTMEVMAKTAKKMTTIEKAVKKLKEIGNTEI